MKFKVGDRVEFERTGDLATVEKLRSDGNIMCVRFDNPSVDRRWSFESGWTNSEGFGFLRAFDNPSDFEFDI